MLSHHLQSADCKMAFGALSFSSIITSSSIASSCRSTRGSIGFVCALAASHFLKNRSKSSFANCTWDYSNAALVCRASGTDVGAAISSSAINGYPKYNRLLPCPLQNGPPRVEHLVVSEGGPVLEYISNALDLPHLFVSDLIHFGAVYYALVCPEPPPSATPEQVKLFKEVTAPSVLKKRQSIKGKTVREAQKTFRIAHPNEFVEAGTYLRVHIHPKRFPRCYEIDWRSRIIAVTESYVVLDKPAGTSVGGTTDNIEESCVTFASRALGFTTPLKTTHQIDNCTEGCVVLARTKEYCSVFHGKIREKKVKKLYRALAAAPVSVGIITHYMRPVNIAPRLISEDYVKGWYVCQLEVLDCKAVPWPNAIIKENYSVDDCGWPSKDVAYECKINLLTGRTHQVRAQLAACGAPIVGDSMYMPAAIAEKANPGINPFGKYKKDYTIDNDRVKAVEEWIAQHGKEPSIAIALQACQISWDDGEHYYEAKSPWWR
ncbi:RNA pseudouridine synthase 6, chloroplastic isoform X2 [Macadamia integrifolia]|uniref:RNA pseudouridine synthase 6, chloroplastic isoform X2 n=1 Tax=Macadamia integrifolia TaxID=60698 RepID=UPI001C4E461C|nr:RNA pseudouridine synthase 6, chloroplastic isoform X2 [Macadamia integrifolia]